MRHKGFGERAALRLPARNLSNDRAVPVRLARMRTVTPKLLVAVGASALALALSGCVTFSAALPGSSSSAGSPNRIGPEGCGVSDEKVATLVDNVARELGTVQESALAGNIPDLTRLLTPFQDDVAGLTEGVTDPELLAALTDVQAGFTGFADIPAPQNVLEAAGWVQEFTAQLQELRDSGAALQELCTAP